ncbi:glycosyltransferase, partial [Patescibacteria group bacterium]|nr:glycosyltransferase [Patescibacteria group bacterium]MBU1868258.1 glycosyltransferase [Patescibacteria group bacterium]
WVQFLGSVDHKDLPKVYTNALFTVVPSIQESFGMVAIESLACGTPVIASDAGGLPEIVTANCGLIFPAGNINTLAKNMKKLLEDDKLRDRLTKGAIEQARQFSWEKTVEKLEKVYLQHQ